MSEKKVLIIDDDKQICKILRDYFEFEGFEVVLAEDGKEGMKKARQEEPDIIILDIMLPKMDGWKVCKNLRTSYNTPIIMLSAKDKDADRINGLEMGADDYVTKPFSPKEVVVRAQTVLRRINSDTEEEEILRFPNLVINNNYRRVKVKENEVDLTPKEFDLLWVMASTAKKVFTRDELLQKVWGYNYFGDVRTVDTHIKSLRNKLGEEAARYIKTVWGVGYKFEVLE